MADMTTDVLIIGTGPAGSATAALLSTYGIENMAINRYRWLANTPRAHITNQRTMEVLRDLGREVEDEAYMHAAGQDLMGENVFCESLAGEEIGRMKSWGTHPLSKAEHLLSLGVLAIAIMLIAPRGIWGLISERTGLQLFPIRRRLKGGQLDNLED